MNPGSLTRTLPGERTVRSATLRGYQRAFNKKTIREYLALNIVPNPEYSVRGKIIDITREEFSELKKREGGYTCTDVTAAIYEATTEAVYAFIAPDTSYPDVCIPLTYLLTCLGGIAANERNAWLKETRIQSQIFDDRANPLYRNAEYSTLTDAATWAALVCAPGKS